jgi:hypothetical protein
MIAKTTNLMAASCISSEHTTTRRRNAYGEIKYESLELPNLKKDPHQSKKHVVLPTLSELITTLSQRRSAAAGFGLCRAHTAARHIPGGRL